MFCVKPLDCWRCGTCVCDDGVTSPRLVFSYSAAFDYYARLGLGYHETIAALERSRMSLACGKCEACQIRKRKDMAVRLSNEVQCYDECCFLTLTYNKESIPVSHPNHQRQVLELTRGVQTRGDDGLYTLVPSDVQKFFKRLRRHLEYVPKRKTDKRDHVSKPIRYFCVGEYGSKSHRPHYHLIIFGWKPSDQIVHQIKDGYTINRSAQIEKLWTYGFSTVAEVNHGVAKYCAQYVTKKYLSSVASELYPYVVPEFTLQSTRNGGIGATWLNRYFNNLRQGFINIRNGERISKCAIPRYYYDRLRKINLPLWLELRDERIEWIRRNPVVSDYDEILRKVEVERHNLLYAISKETL